MDTTTDVSIPVSFSDILLDTGIPLPQTMRDVIAEYIDGIEHTLHYKRISELQNALAALCDELAECDAKGIRTPISVRQYAAQGRRLLSSNARNQR